MLVVIIVLIILVKNKKNDLLKDKTDIAWRRLGDVQIRGKKERVCIYEAFDQSKDLEWIETFNKGMAAMEAGESTAAVAFFQDADTQRDGGDAASLSLIEKLTQS